MRKKFEKPVCRFLAAREIPNPELSERFGADFWFGRFNHLSFRADVGEVDSFTVAVEPDFARKTLYLLLLWWLSWIFFVDYKIERYCGSFNQRINLFFEAFESQGLHRQFDDPLDDLVGASLVIHCGILYGVQACG